MQFSNLDQRLARFEKAFDLGSDRQVHDPSSPDYPWRDQEDPFWTPMTFREFLAQNNAKLYPNQIADLEQVVGTDPKLAFSEDNPCPQQAVLAVGKGGGKGYTVSWFTTWAIHVLLCLKCPATYLGQAIGENLDIVICSYNRAQAQSVILHKIKARMKACPWMKEAIARITGVPFERYYEGHFGAETIRLPHDLTIWALAAGEGADGKNTLIYLLDEVGAWTSPVKQNIAERIHDILKSSAQTRFKRRWRGFIVSYPRHSGDYLMQLRRKYEAGELPNTYSVIRATWEWNEAATRESLEDDYRENPEKAAQLYECDAPLSEDSYFRSPELVPLHCSGATIETLRQYLDLPDEQLEAIASLGQNPILSVDSYGDPLLDRRGFPKLAGWFRGQKSPAGDPYEYFAHLDPGLSGDGFGFAMGHLHQFDGGFQPVIDLAFRWTGRMFKDFGTIRRMSWFVGVPETQELVTAAEVDFRTVREFIFFLRQARGFDLGLVSFDRWNSAESVQELRKRDVPVSLRVVNKEDYDEFKNLVYNRQLRYYGWPILIDECYKLQLVNGTKIEAPRTRKGDGVEFDSHKDVSDCVAAIARRLSLLRDESVEFYTAPPVEDLFEKAAQKKEPVDVAASFEATSAMQQRILAEFFNEG